MERLLSEQQVFIASLSKNNLLIFNQIRAKCGIGFPQVLKNFWLKTVFRKEYFKRQRVCDLEYVCKACRLPDSTTIPKSDHQVGNVPLKGREMTLKASRRL
jgi:hypothetical protein